MLIANEQAGEQADAHAAEHVPEPAALHCAQPVHAHYAEHAAGHEDLPVLSLVNELSVQYYVDGDGAAFLSIYREWWTATSRQLPDPGQVVEHESFRSVGCCCIVL